MIYKLIKTLIKMVDKKSGWILMYSNNDYETLFTVLIFNIEEIRRISERIV